MPMTTHASRRDFAIGTMASASTLLAATGTQAQSTDPSQMPPQAEDTALVFEDLLTIPETPEQLDARLTRRLTPIADATTARLKRWAALYPRLADQTRRSADEALEGLHALDGTKGRKIFIGDPVLWNVNPTDDINFISMLNRMGWWQDLLKTWIVTGDPAYAAKVAAELDAWIAQNPRPLIDPARPRDWRYQRPWRTLECGIRMIDTWPMAVTLLVGTPFMPTARLQRVIEVMHHHGRVLAEIGPLNSLHGHGNWLTFQMTGLLCLTGTLLELKSAPSWQATAWAWIEKNIKASILASGGQEEGTPHYHNLAVSLISRSIETGRRQGQTLRPEHKQLVRNAVDYTLHSARPNGNNVPYADSDTGATAIDAVLGASVAIGYWQSLAVLKSFVASDRVIEHAARSYADVDRPDSRLDAIRQLKPATMARHFWAKDLDEAMIRTDWTGAACSVFFACRTTGNGHAHMDQAGFDYCALGRPILVDPGRYTYADSDDRRLFKSASMHNTVTVNDREPMAYLAPFAFGPLKEAHLIREYLGDGFIAYEAKQASFDPAIHHRVLAMLDTGELIVIDRLSGLEPGDKVQIWYHFDTINLEWDDGGREAVTTDAAMTNVAVTVSEGLSGRLVDGFVSDTMNIRRPSRRLRLESTTGEATRHFVTHIRPTAAGAEATMSKLAIVPRADGHYAVSYAPSGAAELVWMPESALTRSGGHGPAQPRRSRS